MPISLNTGLFIAIVVLVIVLAVLLVILAVNLIKGHRGRRERVGPDFGEASPPPPAPHTQVLENSWQTVIVNEQSPDVRWSILVADEDVLVGREKDCGIHLDDLSVSRHHCRLQARGDGLYVVCEENTTNKTKVNGVEVQTELRLKTGDNLKAGRVTLHIESLQRGDESVDGKTSLLLPD